MRSHRSCALRGNGNDAGSLAFPRSPAARHKRAAWSPAPRGPCRRAEYVAHADSGALMRRSFCPDCGTPEFSEAEPRPNVIVVRAGTLDDPEAARPTGVIWTASAPSWACFDPDLPRDAGQPVLG
jgi:hypothetical protein